MSQHNREYRVRHRIPSGFSTNETKHPAERRCIIFFSSFESAPISLLISVNLVLLLWDTPCGSLFNAQFSGTVNTESSEALGRTFTRDQRRLTTITTRRLPFIGCFYTRPVIRLRMKTLYAHYVHRKIHVRDFLFSPMTLS